MSSEPQGSELQSRGHEAEGTALPQASEGGSLPKTQLDDTRQSHPQQDDAQAAPAQACIAPAYTLHARV